MRFDKRYNRTCTETRVFKRSSLLYDSEVHNILLHWAQGLLLCFACSLLPMSTFLWCNEQIGRKEAANLLSWGDSTQLLT